MKEPMFRIVLGAICAALLCVCGTALSQEPIPEKGPIPDDRGFQPTNPDRVAKVKVVVRHIQGQAYVIAGAGGNMVVFAGDDGILLADTNFTVLYDQIVPLIRRISNKPIRYIMNTHPHGDHTQNNENFAKQGAIVIGHPNLRKAMIDASTKGPASGPGANPKGGFPVITTAAPITLYFNGEEVIFMPLKPAHTDADMAVYFKKSDVFVFGDVYRTDYPSIGEVEGATVDTFLDNYKMALDMTTPNTIFVPGHGQLSTRQDLSDLREVVVQLYARFRDMVARGMTLEQIMEARPSREWDARFASESKSPTTGNTVQRVYTRMYASIKKEMATKQ
jgi:glyoxylase-like metal-dependent hydrolase (beta-lactamase superfamily II)